MRQIPGTRKDTDGKGVISSRYDGNFEIVNVYEGIEYAISDCENLLEEFDFKANNFTNTSQLLLTFYEKPLDNLEDIFGVLGNVQIDFLGEFKKDVRYLMNLDINIRHLIWGCIKDFAQTSEEDPMKEGKIEVFRNFEKEYGEIINKIFTPFMLLLAGENYDVYFGVNIRDNNILESIVKFFDNYTAKLIEKVLSSGSVTDVVCPFFGYSGNTDQIQAFPLSRASSGSKFSDIADNERINAYFGMLFPHENFGTKVNVDIDISRLDEGLIDTQRESFYLLVDIAYNEAVDFMNKVGYETPVKYDLSLLPENEKIEIYNKACFFLQVGTPTEYKGFNLLDANVKNRLIFIYFAAKVGSILNDHKKISLQKGENETDENFNYRMETLEIVKMAYKMDNGTLDIYKTEYRECLNKGLLKGISKKGTLRDKYKLPLLPDDIIDSL